MSNVGNPRNIANVSRSCDREGIHTSATIPLKRPSSSTDNDFRMAEETQVTPQPARISLKSFDSSVSKCFSPTTPKSSTSMLMPFRSPRPNNASNSKVENKSAKPVAARGNGAASPLKSLSSFRSSNLPMTKTAIVKNGEVIEILDSDEDDSESLESLEDIFGRPKVKEASNSTSPDVQDTKGRKQDLNSRRFLFRGISEPLVGKDKLRTLYAKERAHKFDISAFLDDHFDDEDIQINVKKAQAGYDATKRENDIGEKLGDEHDLLATVVREENGDNDNVSRLMFAVERTEVLTTENTFRFFSRMSEDEIIVISSGFPNAGDSHQLWQRDNEESLAQAFLSGHVADIGAEVLVPNPINRWIAHSVAILKSDDLRQAYVHSATESAPFWTRLDFGAKDIHDIFVDLGARRENMRGGTPILAQQYPLQHEPKREYKYLLSVLVLFRGLCRDMDFAALSTFTSILCRLAIDDEVMENTSVSAAVEDCLERLLSLSNYQSRIHVAERILSDMGQSLREPALQSRLLVHILPTSRMASQTRVNLAHTFLFGYDSINLDVIKLPVISLEKLSKFVAESSAFDTVRHSHSSAIDYTILKARAQILDVAISDGGRPVTFPSRFEEMTFNRYVDELAENVKSTFVSIADTGASHMRRTEAKDVLQAIYWRLLYNVRTEERKKKHIFDPVTDRLTDGEVIRTQEKSKNFMAQFLSRHKEASMASGSN